MSSRRKASRAARRYGMDVARMRRHRLIWFACLSPLIIVASLLCLKFASMPIAAAVSNSAYHDEQYVSAESRLAVLDPANWFEPYLVHYNRGTDRLQDGDLDGAESELRAAKTAWDTSRDVNKPKHAECKILTNLAVTLERQGDRAEDRDTKVELYDEAATTVEPCASGGGGNADNENQDQSDGAKDRSEQKREANGGEPAEDDQDGQDGSDDPGGNGKDDDSDPHMDDPTSTEDPSSTTTTPSTGTPTDPKSDELDKRNSDANGGDGSDTGSSTETKPW